MPRPVFYPHPTLDLCFVCVRSVIAIIISGYMDCISTCACKFLRVARVYMQDGSPMLLKPSAKGFSIIVEYLLQRGANPNDCNPVSVVLDDCFYT